MSNKTCETRRRGFVDCRIPTQNHFTEINTREDGIGVGPYQLKLCL